MAYVAIAGAQPAALEVQRSLIFECFPTFSAIGNQLLLYRKPDLRSESVIIPYRQGWRIPAPRDEAISRILSVGRLRVIQPDTEMYCPVPDADGSPELSSGEIVEYLYREAEGRGRIRVGDAECVVRAYSNFGFFELVQEPEVQRWLRVYYADGTSPGWLLNDGTQAYLSCSG